LTHIQDQQKQAAAEYAVAAVRDGMVVGLGTGSTAEFAIRALGERVRQGLRLTGVPTSRRSADLAREFGISLTELQDAGELDLTIDGADEIVPGTLAALKGRGGALLREKLVALASARLVLIVDDSKIVERLGSRFPVPVEVVPFGWRVPSAALAGYGGRPQLRTGSDGSPQITDNGNYILDVDFGLIDDPGELAGRIKMLTGVVDHGLFLNMVSSAVVAGPEGVRELNPSRL
jgi:ribose 5-phosphate isomerase A